MQTLPSTGDEVGDAPSRPVEDVEPAARKHLLVLVAFAIGVIAVFGTSPVVTNGDSFLVAPTASSLIREGNFEITEYVGRGTDGGLAFVDGRPYCPAATVHGLQIPRALPAGARVFDQFSWTTAALVSPLAVVFQIPGLIGLDRFDLDTMVANADTGLFMLVGASLLSGASVFVITITAWLVLDLPPRRRRNAALVVGAVTAFGTPMWSTLSRALWNQTTAVLFLSLAVLCAALLSKQAARGRHEAGLATALGATVGAAYATRPTALVLVVAFGAWLFTTRRHALARYVLGGLVVAIPWVGVNLATYGTLQPPYFDSHRAGLRHEWLQALAGNLVSPNRGLFVFSSVAVISVVGFVLALRRRGPVERRLAIALGVGFVAHLLVVSGSGEDWWAGTAYGPRFMSETIPVLALLALPAVTVLATSATKALRVGAVVLIVASVLMHMPGAWSKPAQCWTIDPVDVNAQRVWDFGDPQAFRPIRTLARTGSLREAVFRRCDRFLFKRTPVVAKPGAKPKPGQRVLIGHEDVLQCLVREAKLHPRDT